MPTTLATTSSDAYLDLVQSFSLRPIRSQSAHQQAKAKLRNLIGKRGSAIRDYKTVLTFLVAEYERTAQLALDTSGVTPAQIVLHLLDERGLSASALAKSVGISASSLSDMLEDRRDWSKLAIVRLCDLFGLQPEIFLR
jgi:antitoxin component HigA of HigAB toxin-antitoxin module